MLTRKKPELLAPAGNLEKLKYAIAYGADAVYCAGKRFGLRARADNFDEDALKEAVKIVHDADKKIYVTLNMIPKDEDFDGLCDFAAFLDEIGVDAVLISDPGVFSVVREAAPRLPIHISTQANNTNSHTVKFWHDMGASRIVLARELSKKDLEIIQKAKPEAMETEIFVHGAMCISYSGRCLLSHSLTGRDSNQGDCAQPCRWGYTLSEKQRPKEHFDLEDDAHGSFIMNSKDLCLARRLPELMTMGIDSFKIEGRMKSAYYVALVTSVYRRIIDAAFENEGFVVPDDWVEELTKVSHRHYTEAFYKGMTDENDQNYGTSSYTRHYDFCGVVESYDPKTKTTVISQRGKILLGDHVEFVVPGEDGIYFSQKVNALFNERGEPIDATPHAKMIYSMPVDRDLPQYSLLRKKAGS